MNANVGSTSITTATVPATRREGGVVASDRFSCDVDTYCTLAALGLPPLAARRVAVEVTRRTRSLRHGIVIGCRTAGPGRHPRSDSRLRAGLFGSRMRGCVVHR